MVGGGAARRCRACILVVLGLQLARVGGQGLPRCRDAGDCLECFQLQVRACVPGAHAARRVLRGRARALRDGPRRRVCQECTQDPNDDSGKNVQCVPCGW